MTDHGIKFPGESEEYRAKRDQLLEAEMALRAQVEEVAQQRRNLPLGGLAPEYIFIGADGPVTFAELFGKHSTLIVYSFMYGADSELPCPMCSAFLDSLQGQVKHLDQRVGIAVVARSSIARISKLVGRRGWDDVPWYSAGANTYPVDYRSEMPNGAQVPMCNVFVKSEDGIRHFWNSELFFAPSDTHPRHIDTMWPLWSFFDLTPEGRGDFMPSLEYE